MRVRLIDRIKINITGVIKYKEAEENLLSKSKEIYLPQKAVTLNLKPNDRLTISKVIRPTIYPVKLRHICFCAVGTLWRSRDSIVKKDELKLEKILGAKKIHLKKINRPIKIKPVKIEHKCIKFWGDFKAVYNKVNSAVAYKELTFK